MVAKFSASVRLSYQVQVKDCNHIPLNLIEFTIVYDSFTAILDIAQLLMLILRQVHRRIIEPRHEKTNVLVSDLVRHKPGCIATEDS